MSEHDLNQAKSKGGSPLSVWAVSALRLCFSSGKFAQRCGVVGIKWIYEWFGLNLRVQSVTEIQTLGVLQSRLVAVKERCQELEEDLQGGKKAYLKEAESVMKGWWEIKVKVRADTFSLFRIYIFLTSFSYFTCHMLLLLLWRSKKYDTSNAQLSGLWFEGSGVSWLNILRLSKNSAEQMLIMASESWGSMTDI